MRCVSSRSRAVRYGATSSLWCLLEDRSPSRLRSSKKGILTLESADRSRRSVYGILRGSLSCELRLHGVLRSSSEDRATPVSPTRPTGGYRSLMPVHYLADAILRSIDHRNLERGQLDHDDAALRR